jgi:hypothetical protein
MRKFPKVQTLAGRVRRAKKPLEAAAQIGGAKEIRLGSGLPRRDEANAWFVRQEREELRVLSRKEFEARVEFQHHVRILCSATAPKRCNIQKKADSPRNTGSEGQRSPRNTGSERQRSSGKDRPRNDKFRRFSASR